MNNTVLLTGGSGFLGLSLIENMQSIYDLRLVSRTEISIGKGCEKYIVGEFDENTDFIDSLIGVDVVIHTAAIAHRNNSDLFRSVNVNATLNLAMQASESGVSRFVFISSIGVNGISNNSPFKFDDDPNPVETYSISKYEAEIGLKLIAKNTGMDVVIIRPPLVYGKNAPGNFGKLLKIAEKNLPLPLGAINNQRSFVAIDNLVDLIITCIEHPNAANQTFLASDDENISTSNLLKKLILATGKKPWLLPVPVSFLKFMASIVGKKAAVDRFSSSLTVDIEHTKKTLNWKAPITLDEGIRRCFK